MQHLFCFIYYQNWLFECTRAKNRGCDFLQFLTMCFSCTSYIQKELGHQKCPICRSICNYYVETSGVSTKPFDVDIGWTIRITGHFNMYLTCGWFPYLTVIICWATDFLDCEDAVEDFDPPPHARISIPLSRCRDFL